MLKETPLNVWLRCPSSHLSMDTWVASTFRQSRGMLLCTRVWDVPFSSSGCAPKWRVNLGEIPSWSAQRLHHWALPRSHRFQFSHIFSNTCKFLFCFALPFIPTTLISVRWYPTPRMPLGIWRASCWLYGSFWEVLTWCNVTSSRDFSWSFLLFNFIPHAL